MTQIELQEIRNEFWMDRESHERRSRTFKWVGRFCRKADELLKNENLPACIKEIHNDYPYITSLIVSHGMVNVLVGVDPKYMGPAYRHAIPKSLSELDSHEFRPVDIVDLSYAHIFYQEHIPLHDFVSQFWSICLYLYALGMVYECIYINGLEEDPVNVIRSVYTEGMLSTPKYTDVILDGRSINNENIRHAEEYFRNTNNRHFQNIGRDCLKFIALLRSRASEIGSLDLLS